MRQTHVCPKCQHNRILLIETVNDRSGEYDRNYEMHIAQMDDENRYGAKSMFGKVSAVVCKSCGHTELFVAKPSSIPIDGMAVRELVGHEPQGPYR